MHLSIAQQVFLVPLLLALCSFFLGCGGSRSATASDDTFFEPLKSLDRPFASKPSGASNATVVSSWTARADSLSQTMREQQHRLDAIAARLQLLEASRRGGAADSSRDVKGELPQPSKRPSAREQPAVLTYGGALQLYEARRFQGAIDAFEELLRRGVQEDLQDNCHFWIGASHLSLKQFDLALVSLKRVVEWKGSNKKADAYYMMGRTYVQLGNAGQAKSMFEALLKEFPSSGLAPSARQKLKALGPTN